MRGLLLSIIIVLASFNPLLAKGKGEVGGEFLKIGIGERAVGMGEAFCAIADNSTAIYWNPAGLMHLKGREFSAMHLRWMAGVKSESLLYAHPIGKLSAFGVQLTSLYTKEKRRDEYCNEIGTFLNYYALLSIAYARRVAPSLAFGSALKVIYRALDTEKAGNVALDFGILYKTPIKNLKFGANVQHVGLGIKFTDNVESLPTNLKIGLSYLIAPHLIVAVDSNLPWHGKRNFNFGIEYKLGISGLHIFGRTGYKTSAVPDLGNASGLTGGFGLGWKGYFINYSCVPYGELGLTHRFSFSLRF
jgi:hypothetical protein